MTGKKKNDDGRQTQDMANAMKDAAYFTCYN